MLFRSIVRWRRQFRGTPRIVDDRDVTDADIASKNLILWGDAASNSVIARIAGKLPIREERGQIAAGTRRFDAAHHVPILVYPNPLNPERYIVLNSGFTFREYDYLNNARQVPKLPDFAVLDVDVPISARAAATMLRHFSRSALIRPARPLGEDGSAMKLSRIKIGRAHV